MPDSRGDVSAVGEQTLLFRLPLAKIPHAIGSSRDTATTKDMCRQIEALVLLQRQESQVAAMADLATLAGKTRQLWHERDLDRLKLEALQTVVNRRARKTLLRDHLHAAMVDSRDVLVDAQQHRDEFNRHTAERRAAMRGEVRALLESGPTVVARFGDNLSQYTRKLLQVFERNGQAQLARLGIASGLIERAEAPSLLQPDFCLVPPRHPSCLQLSGNQLGVEFPVPIPASYIDTWAAVVANGAFCAPLETLPTLPLAEELVGATLRRIREHAASVGPGAKPMYTHALARVLDAVHPSHGLLAATLSSAAGPAVVVRRRLSALGYDVAVAGPSALTGFDAAAAINVLEAVRRRLQRERRFAVEFSVGNRTIWRVGVCRALRHDPASPPKFPGADADSLGFASDGSVLYAGESREHRRGMADAATLTMDAKTYALVIDTAQGTLRLVARQDDVDALQAPGFGAGATGWSEEQQRAQQHMLANEPLLLIVALQGAQSTIEYNERPYATVNFGAAPFACADLDATPLCAMRIRRQKLWNVSTLFPLPDDSSAALGSTTIDAPVAVPAPTRLIPAPEQLKSFSSFPPSFHRRTTACIRIQRAFRRWRGRRLRSKLLRDRDHAARVIQAVARRVHAKVQLRKRRAAISIQRAWRRRVYVWVCLLKVIYQQPVLELHRSATVIQRAWRNWATFRNSPLCRRYNRRYEVLVAAANRIKAWWRRLHQNRILVFEHMRRLKAVLLLQRVYRGHALRARLEPTVRERLAAVGAMARAHSQQITRLRAAYTIQAAARRFLRRRLRARLHEIRFLAARRIQALWRGYWVRCHSHLSFSYGRLNYLLAVRRNLRAARFSLRAYKPSGLVCPRD